ncbi:MAG: phosphoglucomutase/phosphomannomutase family protein, partial [Candidatus Margulisbacteria bacterium]|nr:phosphoglucomutase/phosphomannomutase family protein [Candidatus Margulisiibacteriota bacterium]
ITASHNPPDWNGFKIKENFGGSARAETTAAIEKLLKTNPTIKPSETNIKLVDPKPDFFAKLKSLVDLDKIKSANLNMIIDPMFGSGAGYFKELGLPVTEIRNYRDPLFGGINPEPLPINLQETFSFVKDHCLANEDKLTACIVLDGDADRVAAIDSNGNFINTHNVLTLLIYHLVKNRKLAGDIVKTFNISQLVDKLCQKYNKKLYITPIGFKHVAKLMIEKDILIGGEESGGMGIKGYIPERDGVLMGLLLFELMAFENKTLGQILNELMAELGYFYYDRADLQTEKASAIVEKLKKEPPHEFAGLRVVKVEDLDGLKFYFENESWILFRASGTEPLLRVYVEARTDQEVKQILGAGEKLAA